MYPWIVVLVAAIVIAAAAGVRLLVRRTKTRIDSWAKAMIISFGLGKVDPRPDEPPPIEPCSPNPARPAHDSRSSKRPRRRAATL
jgi:hypothetical protein